VKLLFDQNLSPFLASRLANDFPGSAHVQDVGLDRADDAGVWDYARANGFIIVSKDSDFHERSVFLDAPPKVVWIRRGNCSTDAIEQLMRTHTSDVKNLVTDDAARFLILF
jgi:predicted nuclease of predicted toxin-antitoxin system